MEAARLHEYTEEMGEALWIDEVDRPEPSRSDHVVEVEGAGWCQTDNHVIEGMWTDYVDQELPMTLGHENAGPTASSPTSATSSASTPRFRSSSRSSRGRDAPRDERVRPLGDQRGRRGARTQRDRGPDSHRPVARPSLELGDRRAVRSDFVPHRRAGLTSGGAGTSWRYGSASDREPSWKPRRILLATCEHAP